MQSYSEWILCPSKSFPGKFYYFNVRNGKAAWGPSDAEILAGRPKETESHDHPQRNSPPASDAHQHTFSISSIQQTPETRPDVTISSMHHVTADPTRNFSSFSSNCQPTPVFGQKSFPQGLPKCKASDTIWIPNQIQGQIRLQNQASTFGAQYPVFRDHLNISEAGRSQVSKSIKGLKYIDTQDGTECKEIVVDASKIPMHQRFVNFEATGISFSRVNKDNIKRLHQKLQTSTPIKKSRPLVDPRLVNKPRIFESKSSFADFRTNILDSNPKTRNSIIKESALNFGVFSNTKQDLNVGLPTKIQEQTNQNSNVWGSLTNRETVFNGCLQKSNEPLFSKSKETSLNFEPLKSKDPPHFEPPSKITEPLFNLEPPLKTNEPGLYFEPPPRTQPSLNAGFHSKTTETFNFDPPLNNPFLNLGPKPKELSNQYLNVGPSSKIKEPFLNDQSLKVRDPVQNGLPSKSTEKEIKKEEKRVLNGSVKSLKSCIKGDKGDNRVAKSFDDDLRAILISRRRSQDFTNTEFQGSKSKITKQETPSKKKVTFNLDHESLSMVSSMEDDEDMKCAFIELYRPTLAYLKALAPSTSRGQDSWCILPDTEVLTKEFEFIDDFVQIDPSCKLLIPSCVHAWLLALARGSDRPLATAARNVLRRNTSAHVVVQPCKDQDNLTCTNDDILRSCVEHMDQNRHLVLISNDLELLTTAKCYPIPCYSMNSIKNGLPTTKPLKYKKDMKITIRNDTQNINNDSVTKSPDDDDLNEKEKAIIRSLRMSEYPIGQNPNLKAKNQNDLNGKIQNDQTEAGSNEKNLMQIKHFYRDENMRIADAIEMYHLDAHNITPSVNTRPTREFHDVSNVSPIQNECMNIEKSFQSMVINQSINNEKCRRKKSTEAGSRYESETKTTKEGIQKLNIKDRDDQNDNTDKTVSIFFKNQKSIDLQKFKYSPKMKISVKSNGAEIPKENNNQKDIEKENQEPLIKNRDPRIEIRKGVDSILDFCKEKAKESSTNEFENGKRNMASQCQKITFEFDKTNKLSQFDTRSKSNMASTIGFDVSKPQPMINRIDLKRFHVKNKDMEHRLKARIDEWICFYTQIMEESLSSILHKISPSELDSLPPWSLFEALQCIDTVYGENSTVNKIVGHLCSCFYDSRYKMKKLIHPEEFMRALGCGAKLLEYLEIILPSIKEIQDGVTALQALLTQIEDDSDPSVGLSESLLTTTLNSQPDELDARHNFVKDNSEVADYLKKHFAAWKDYDFNHNLKVFKTRDEGTKLEKRAKGVHVSNQEISDRNGYVSKLVSKTNNVGKYYCDKRHVETDKNNGVRKESYDKNKTGAMDGRNKHVENNIEYNSNKAKDKLQDEKGPIIVRNVSILKEFETKLRKRKTKPVYVDIKPFKKSKIDVKTASNYQIYNDSEKKDGKVKSKPENTVYRPDKDPKLIRDIPIVVINVNLISDYQEKMRLKKAKKLYNSFKTKDHNLFTKTGNEQDKYINSYNRHNNNHTNVTKNHKESYISDNNQVPKVTMNNNEDNDNNNKDVTTDSGLGNELPRWSSVVDTYTAEIEKSLQFINIQSALASYRVDSETETLRMRAFEMDYLVCRILGMLRRLGLCADDDRARNLDAIQKYMAQAKSIHNIVNSMLLVTNPPLSSGMSYNS